MRRRLVLSYLALTILVLVLFEVPLALIYSRHEHDALDAALQRDAAAVAVYATGAAPGSVPDLARRLAPPGELIMAVDGQGHELTARGLLSSDPDAQRILRQAQGGASPSGEVDDLVFRAARTDNGGAVLVARPDESIDDKVHRAWIALAIVGVVMIGLATVVSLRLSGWLVDPLQRLEKTAARLGSGDLTARAYTNRGPPEVITLSATLNQMATQVDELLQSQRRFVADASHQLRTPLTALRLRLETMDPGVDPAVREAALGELARLSRIVDGLLVLARTNGTNFRRVPVDVDSAVARRIDAWEALAEENEIELRGDSRSAGRAWVVDGHLEQILDNFIDNALGASNAGGSVLVDAHRVDGRVEVHVIDEGRGMTPDERAHAFDPFWRGSHQTPGTGLGLAIVDQLARANGGRVALDPSDTGGVDASVSLEVAP